MRFLRGFVPASALTAGLLLSACDCRDQNEAIQMCAPEVASPTVKPQVVTGRGACETGGAALCEVRRDGQTIHLELIDPSCDTPRPCTAQLIMHSVECDLGTIEPGDYQVVAGDLSATMKVVESGGQETCDPFERAL